MGFVKGPGKSSGSPHIHPGYPAGTWRPHSVPLVEIRAVRTMGLVGAVALAVGGLTAGALPVGAPFYLSPHVRHAWALPATGAVCASAGLTVLVGAWLLLRPLVTGRP